MKTKAFARYLNRTAHFDADLELADVFSRQSYQLHKKSTKAIFDGVDKNKHPRLSSRKATDHNRKLALKHLNVTLRGAYIKDIYEELSHYLVAIIRCCAMKSLDPDRLLGEQKILFDANTLLKLGSWDAVVRKVADVNDGRKVQRASGPMVGRKV